MHATLEQIFPDNNNKAIIIPQGPELTYHELREALDSFAAVLRSNGINKGDAVAVYLVNGLEFVISFVGTTWARAIAAPLNPKYGADECAFYLEDCKAKAIIVPRGQGKPAREAAGRFKARVWEAVWDNQTKKLRLYDASNGSVELTAESNDVKKDRPVGGDVSLILHTSGTTSRPKAVPLTHENIATTVRNIIHTYKLKPTDRSLVVMPLFHVHGLIGALLSTFGSGGTNVIQHDKFSASSFWKDFHTYQCTWYSAVPTIHSILLRNESSNSSQQYRGKLKFIRSCSSSLPPAVFEAMEKTFGVPVVEAYAMTENAHQMTSNDLPPGKRKPGAVGRGQGVEIAILDEDGNKLPQGKEGEVCTKGKNVTPGYLNNEEANKKSFTKDGWFRTGDQGYLDEDGFVFLTGRLKELINRGGEKIAPQEIDDALTAHEWVSEAVTFGAPDDLYGQVVHAAIVLNKTGESKRPEEVTESLKKFLGGKLVAFKIPAKFHYAKDVPRTSTGKIQRRHVADHFLKSSTKSKL